MSMDRSGLVNLLPAFKEIFGSASTVRLLIVLYAFVGKAFKIQCEDLFHVTIQKICPSIMMYYSARKTWACDLPQQNIYPRPSLRSEDIRISQT